MVASISGFVNLSLDLYDRPQFVHELMRFSTDWLTEHYRTLGETGIHSSCMDDTGSAPASISPTTASSPSPTARSACRPPTTPATS